MSKKDLKDMISEESKKDRPDFTKAHEEAYKMHQEALKTQPKEQNR